MRFQEQGKEILFKFIPFCVAPDPKLSIQIHFALSISHTHFSLK